jgi:hypothetical protein
MYDLVKWVGVLSSFFGYRALSPPISPTALSLDTHVSGRTRPMATSKLTSGALVYFLVDDETSRRHRQVVLLALSFLVFFLTNAFYQ